MEENAKDKDEGPEPLTLQPRRPSNPVVSIAKKLGMKTLAVISVYLLGYFDFSLAWMITPLLLSVLKDHWKKDKRNKLTAAREAALTNEQAMIEARMNAEEMPAWVFFPDKERAEWVNRILKQLWPFVNEYVRHTLFYTVEPLVESALKDYKLTPFKFEREKVFLGQVPPRITGIKVYDTNISRKEIIMDLDIVFASDLEIVFKVKGISARVSDFGLRGMVRVVLKPLISQIPIVGGLQVYFLKAPEIDYNLGGVAGALEIPGLNKIVEGIIIEQVKNFIVLPNKFSMPLVDSIPNKVLKCPDSAGVLRVKLIRASDLVDNDGFGSGKSDPYVIMTVGAYTHRFPTIMDTFNPHWDLTYDFPIEVIQGQELLIEVYDEDDRQDDEFLGRAKIQTSVVAERGFMEGYWVELDEIACGKVQVTLSWLPVTADSSAVKVAAKNTITDDHSAKGLVHIYIDSCSGLVNQRDPDYKHSPMVRVISPHEKSQQSWPKHFTNEPIIEQGFVMLTKAPYTDELRIDVIDTASKKDEVIGTCNIRLWTLIEQPGMEYSLQPWLLKGKMSDAKIVMSVSVRGLLPPQCELKPSKTEANNGESFSAPSTVILDAVKGEEALEMSWSEYDDSPLEENTADELSIDGSIYNLGDIVDPMTTLRKRHIRNQGKIRLNIIYDENKQELKVFVHKAANLPGSYLPDPPDPYVKLYLMPDKKKKKKTAVVKDTGSPKFNEEFDFSIEHNDVPKHFLKLTVVDNKGVFAKSKILGGVEIALDNPGLKQGLADWYPLEDSEEDSDSNF